MKLHKHRDFGRSGIYCIRNIVNNKVYIGKAKCIYRRIKDHITRLNTRNKDENIHLINSWHKYGRDKFEYLVLEYLNLEEEMKLREIFWMKQFNSLNREKGYNLREDSSTSLIVSNETRKKLSEAQKKRFQDPKERKKCSHGYWSKNRERMSKIKKENPTIKYSIEQYTKEKVLIKVWTHIVELIEANPTYKKHNIYAVCSGEKPSMYGFIWKKIIKI